MNRKWWFYSEKYARNLSVSSHRLGKMLKVLQRLNQFNRVLDVGCGDGSFSVYLKKVCKEVYGVDISPEAVYLALRRGIKAYALDVDSESLPFADAYFDLVVAGDIIEHLYDPDHLLDEIYRVLRRGGLLVLSTPNLGSWYNRILLFLGYQPHYSEVSLKYNVGKFFISRKMREEGLRAVGGHIRLFTYRALKEIVQLHSFKVKQVAGADFSESMPFPLSLIEKVFSKRPSLASFLILVAEKAK